MTEDNKIQEGEQLALPGFEPVPPTAQEITSNMFDIEFKTNYMRSPEDTLAFCLNKPRDYVDSTFRGFFYELVNIVAAQTGADPEQIANKNTRTEEQERLLTEAAAKRETERLEAYLKSAYMDALSAIVSLKGSNLMKPWAATYFFALHSELNPTAAESLTEEHKEELASIFYKLDKFYTERISIAPDENIIEILRAFIDQEHPDPAAIIEKLPILQSIKPASHTIANHKLMNALQGSAIINTGDQDPQGVDLVVVNADKKKRRKEITSYTIARYDQGNSGIELKGANLTEYERQVSDAVISLWIEATQQNMPPLFSVDAIFRSMPGGSEEPSDQQKQAIITALEKLRRLHIYVDATEELKKRGYKNIDYIFDEYFLNFRRHRAKTKNGAVITNGFEILSKPVMLTYCELTNQRITMPANQLEINKIDANGKTTPALVPMTAERQAMAGYILRQIGIMKNDEKEAKEKKRSYDNRRKRDKTLDEKPLEFFRAFHSRAIKFDTIFTAAGITTADRVQIKRNRDFCFSVMKDRKAKGIIKDYKEQRKGKKITGIEIEL